MKTFSRPIGAMIAALSLSAMGLSAQQSGQYPQTPQTQQQAPQVMPASPRAEPQQPPLQGPRTQQRAPQQVMPPSPVTQTQQQSVTGSVVERDGMEVTIRTTAGQTMAFTIDANTRLTGSSGQISTEQRQQQLGALRTGDQVTIQYRQGATPQQMTAVQMTLPATTAAQPAPARLPQTAGQLPVISVLGLLSLLGAAGAGAAVRRAGRKDEV